MVHTDKIFLCRCHETLSNIVTEGRLVVFGSQHIISALVDHLRRDFLLATHSVDRHQGTMYIQKFQQLGNRRNFVGFLVHSHLAQTQAVGRCPGADQVQSLQTIRSRCTQRFAVDSNGGETQGVVQSMHPGAEASLKRLRIKPIKDAFKGIMRGSAVGQAEEFFEPIMAAPSKGFDLLPVVAATDDGTDGNGDDVDEEMLFAAVDARIFEFAEIRVDRQVGMSHDSPP